MLAKEWWPGIAVYHDSQIELLYWRRWADRLDQAVPAADIVRTPAVSSLDILLVG